MAKLIYKSPSHLNWASERWHTGNTMQSSPIYLWTLLYLLYITCFTDAVDVNLKLVKDLLRNEKQPSLLNIHSCHPRETNVRLLQYLSASSSVIPYATQTTNVIRKEEQHQVWSVFDMKCNGSRAFLRQVSSTSTFHVLTYPVFNAI